MQYAALTYNVFALSTLLFVGQLEQIPDHALHIERLSVCRMFPGPGTWIVPEDLWYMSENFGCCKSPQPLSLVARAAQFRVATLGCHFTRKRVCPTSLRRRKLAIMACQCSYMLAGGGEYGWLITIPGITSFSM